MKKTLFIVIIGALFDINTFAQNIEFQENTTWDNVLSEAKLKDKLIFVDVYTDWCGPCKRMDKEVFSEKSLSEKMNESFINYKLNAEKGIGISLSNKYNVFSYPTYLFINGNGTLIYRSNGYMPVQKFMAEISNALTEQKDTVTLLQMDSIYATKKTDTTFMYAYLLKRTKLRQDNSELLDEYCTLLDTVQQSSLKTLQLIADNGAFDVRSLQIGKALSLLLNNKQKFSLLNNIEDIDNYISLAQQKTLAKAISMKSDSLLDVILKINRERHLDIYDDDYDDMWKLSYYYKTGQEQKYIDIATNYLDKKLMTITDSVLNRKDKLILDNITKELETSLANKTETEKQEALASYKHTQTIQLIRTINKICNNILSVSSNKKLLQQGIKWMNRSVSLAEKDTAYFKYVYPYCLKIYASYLYKIGKKSQAISLQSKAVNLISIPGIADDAAEIEAYKSLLTKMKQSKDILTN